MTTPCQIRFLHVNFLGKLEINKEPRQSKTVRLLKIALERI